MSSCNICRKSWVNQNIKMFHVPINQKKRQKWNEACGKKLKDNAKICELHFLKTDIILNEKRRRLKANALPILNLQTTMGDENSGDESSNMMLKIYDDSNTSATPSIMEFNSDEENVVEGTIIERISTQALYKQFIDEARFDETVPALQAAANEKLKINHKDSATSDHSYRSITTQTGCKDMQLCGTIAVAITESNTYSMNCFYCDFSLPLWNWTKFISHIKEKHLSLEESFKQYDDLYADAIDCKVSVHNESTTEDLEHNTSDSKLSPSPIRTKKNAQPNIINGNINEEPMIKGEDEYSLTSCEEEFQLQHVDILNSQNEEENDMDEIRFGRTDKEIVMDFLNMFKKFRVLWETSVDSKEEYNAAVNEITSELNRKWQINLTNSSVYVSLNRIRNWYRNVCTNSNDSINSRYPKYFKKCAEFLSTPAESTSRSLKVECEICRSLFMDDAHLQVHQYKRHQIGQLPYKCQICEHCFATRELLIRHENFHNREKKFVCSECNKSFYLEKHFKAHMIVHKICNICGKKCSTKSMFAMHKITHEPPKYKCNICGKSYFRRERLHEHLKAHRNERDYVCDQCGKSFIRQRALAVHKKSVHSGIKKYVCTICNIGFKTPNGLYIHRKTYHLVLEGSIEEMSKIVKAGSIYNKHTYVLDPKTQRRRLVCDLCGNTYSRHGGLNVHKINAHGYVPLKHRKKTPKGSTQQEESINEISETNEDPTTIAGDINDAAFMDTVTDNIIEDVVDTDIDEACILYENIMASDL